MDRSLARYLYRPAAVVGGLCLLAITLLTVLDVALRHVLGAPVPGVFEMTELAMIGIVFLGLGEAQHRRQHITIDLIYDRAPPPVRRMLDVLALTGTASLVLLVAWQLVTHLERVRVGGEVMGVLGLPIYPAVAVAGVGFGLFGLASMADLVTALGAAARSPEGRAHDA
jgi:TRAP-type C4-dicarboxylate transport system permease small subunit